MSSRVKVLVMLQIPRMYTSGYGASNKQPPFCLNSGMEANIQLNIPTVSVLGQIQG
jgi:hypothetical protein